MENNIAECHVKVRPSPLVAGNGLFATADLAPGSLVLALKRPLIAVLDLPRVQDTCSNCFAQAVVPIADGGVAGNDVAGGVLESVGGGVAVNACAGCGRVKYCCKKCQSQAWKRGHKRGCSALKAQPPLPSAVRAAWELATIVTGNGTPEQVKRDVQRLEKHDVRSTTNQSLLTVAKAVREIVANDGTRTAESGGTDDCVGRIWRNALTLVTPTFDPLGLVFDPLLCTANHSCSPNTVVVMDGPAVSFRSLTHIAKGEEVFISYIDHTNPFHRRQAELKDRFSFICKCSKCALGTGGIEDEWKQPTSALDQKFEQAGDVSLKDTAFAKEPANFCGTSPDEQRLAGLQGYLFNELETARATKDPHEATKTLEAAMRFCHDTKMWPLTRQPYAAARNELFAHHILTDSPFTAMVHMIKTYFAIDPVLYPQAFHPVRVVHAWSLVKVLMWLYERPNDPNVRKLFEAEFDFVVAIWKLLKHLRQDVVKSHGPGRFQMMVQGTAEQVAGEIGDHNVALLEKDPQGQWQRFKKLGDTAIY